MEVITNIYDMKKEIKKAKKEEKTIGFVPTMGFLHKGHLFLIEKAKKENELTIVSIFVNPIQFNEAEDLKNYPVDLDRDKKLIEAINADYLFMPSRNEMYQEGYNTYIDVEGGITKHLCGKSREGHFRGVATVVMKLFNIIQPDRAYFGQKDAQQLAVIEQIVTDMNMDVKIIPCPIIRQEDGLALSSRNFLLNTKERQDATVISKSLFMAKEMINDGERNASKIIEFISNNIDSVESADIDYVEVVNPKTLEKIEQLKGDILIAAAVRIGKVRLIDNIRMEV